MNGSDSVACIKGVGPVLRQRLEAVGCSTVGDLLLHFPIRYEDRSEVLPLGGELFEQALRSEQDGHAFSFTGAIRSLQVIRTRRRGFQLVRGVLHDGGGQLPIVWFNQPYLARQIDGDSRYRVHGRLRRRGEVVELQNPTCERVDDEAELEAIVPIYGKLGELGPAQVTRLLRQVVAELPGELALEEALPESLRAAHRLPRLGEAVHALHLPTRAHPEAESPIQQLERCRSRLIYEELLGFQLQVAATRRERSERRKPHRYAVDDDLRDQVRAVLPFRLTPAQRRSLGEIVADLRRPEPMTRLLQGDVGSGKTIVAALASVVALANGLDVQLMVPTELLAEQHFASLRRLLEGRYPVHLQTAQRSTVSGSKTQRSRSQRPGVGGDTLPSRDRPPALWVGTHALLEDREASRPAGLIIVDEQHRFGVAQRERLVRKSGQPDLLVMTATPIPRTLALTYYGDLDVSIVDELPPGRRPVRTDCRPVSKRKDAIRKIASELEQGHRGFVVFPRIESSDGGGVSLEDTGALYEQQLPGWRCSIVHGRLSAQERQDRMRAFAEGEVDLLLATTVVEVGVDVPEATFLVIEGAERFGLAQLHQLRGRVGRGQSSSWCLALHDRLTPEAAQRLHVFAEIADGFELAENDLRQRGPGELLGTRQAGLPALQYADLLRDQGWLRKARSDATAFVEENGAEAARQLSRRLLPRQAFLDGPTAGALG